MPKCLSRKVPNTALEAKRVADIRRFVRASHFSVGASFVIQVGGLIFNFRTVAEALASPALEIMRGESRVVRERKWHESSPGTLGRGRANYSDKLKVNFV